MVRVAGCLSRRISQGIEPIEDSTELRLSSFATFSFSRRRLSRSSLTNRVNYDFLYQSERRLDGRVDAVGRVKIQAGPIGTGSSIGCRGTVNEKITCLALSAGLRNRNRLDPVFFFPYSFRLHRRPVERRDITSWERSTEWLKNSTIRIFLLVLLLLVEFRRIFYYY